MVSSLRNGIELVPLDSRLGLYRPDYTASISQVISSAARVLFPDNEKFKDALDFRKNGEHDIVVNFLVDSMGSWQLDQLVHASRCVKEFTGTIDRHLSSVFPTITSTCVISYHSALTPAQHGVLNQRIYMEELDSIVDTLTLKTMGNQLQNTGEPLYKAGINVVSWLINQPEMYPALDRLATRVHVAPWPIKGTGLSRFFQTGDENEHFLGRGSVLTAFGLVDRLIQKHQEGKKTFINVYLGELDQACHDYGPVSEMFRLELEHFIHGFYWLVKQASTAKAGVFFTVTADHGQTDLSPDPGFKVILDPVEFVNAKRTFRSGRVIQFHSLDGRQDELRDELLQRFSDKGVVISGDEILDLTGFSARKEPLKDLIKKKILSRIGDHLVILADGFNAETKKEPAGFSKKEPIIKFKLNGQHGSLTEKELVVPLVTGSAAVLREKLANLEG